jgi:hypothetical protein
MEAEYNALSIAMRDILPLQNITNEILSRIGMEEKGLTRIYRTIVHEDNEGALRLARLEPGRMTPRSKHYGVKYHWFRETVADKEKRIVMERVMTTKQRADFLTKSLRPVNFKENRKLTCGW